MKTLFCLLLCTVAMAVNAQTSLNDMLKQQMVKDWERAKLYTDEYLEAMPADNYSFRATDSVRTFAQQMLHLTVANAGLLYAIGARDPIQNKILTRDLERTATAQTKDSVVYFVNGSYDLVINAIKNMDFTKLDEVVSFQMPGGNRSETRLAWLLKAFEHQTHHRGQCTVYIRLVGLRPPAEKLF